jgi:hypothetical protein
MTPDDFKFDLLEHAYALRRSCIARSGRSDLDPKTTTWLVTYDAWKEFLRSADIVQGHLVSDLRTGRKALFDLPIRITVDDEEGTPPIQLLMEPMRSPARAPTGRGMT